MVPQLAPQTFLSCAKGTHLRILRSSDHHKALTYSTDRLYVLLLLQKGTQELHLSISLHEQCSIPNLAVTGLSGMVPKHKRAHDSCTAESFQACLPCKESLKMNTGVHEPFHLWSNDEACTSLAVISMTDICIKDHMHTC